jgi:hypothetical protein
MDIITKLKHRFIPGRQISNCVIIASEAMNVLNKKGFAGNLALKIDIKKAFDTIEWSFLGVDNGPGRSDSGPKRHPTQSMGEEI